MKIMRKQTKKYLGNKNLRNKAKPIKKIYLVIILIVCLILIFSLVFFILIPAFKQIKQRKEEERIKNATVIVDLKDDLSIPFLEDAKVTDFILNINGTVVSDYNIDTSEVGEKEVTFEYINDENIKIPYTYKLNVVDDG